MVFITFIPLFYVVLMYHCTFAHGLWWGFLCWTGQLYALFGMVIERGEGALRIFAPLFLILYCAAYSAIAFYSASALSNNKRLELRACIWVVCITGYYLIMRYAALWIIGLSTGYPLALPLLPLAEHPQFLVLLPYISAAGLLVCALIFSMSSAYYLVARNWWALCMGLCALLPFGVGWRIKPVAAYEPALIHMCGAVTSPPKGIVHPRDCAQDINARITELLARRPEVQVILMPESSYPFELNEQEDVINLWSINALHKGQLLVIGSYYQEEGDCYNGIYGIAECRVIFNYVKNCRMPFTEYVPFPWSMFSCTQHLFLKNKQGFSTKKSVRMLPLTADFWVQPALCSEFFFDAYDPTVRLPILALVNDSWFSSFSIKRLMYLFARFAAIERSMPIMYISYTYAVFIDKQGNEWCL
jgi:apolipoprotein N-acyltransferase